MSELLFWCLLGALALAPIVFDAIIMTRRYERSHDDEGNLKGELEA